MYTKAGIEALAEDFGTEAIRYNEKMIEEHILD